MVKTVIHPEYDEDFVDNDVALLKFSTDNKDDVFGESPLTSRTNKKKTFFYLRDKKYIFGFLVGAYVYGLIGK